MSKTVTVNSTPASGTTLTASTTHPALSSSNNSISKNTSWWPTNTSGQSMWATPSNMTFSGSHFSSGLSSSFTCATDAEFEGDIKWKGRSLGKLLEKIEDRLAILQEPSQEKLEKFAALKKAYEHYKLMETLIGED